MPRRAHAEGTFPGRTALTMADLLAAAAAWLQQQNRAYMAQTITYRRGELSADLPAKIGRTLFQIDDTEGVQVNVEAIDWIVAPSDLALGGSAVLPRSGDRIIAGGKTYQVMPLGSEPPWRYADGYQTEIRIHSKLVS